MERSVPCAPAEPTVSHRAFTSRGRHPSAEAEAATELYAHRRLCYCLYTPSQGVWVSTLHSETPFGRLEAAIMAIVQAIGLALATALEMFWEVFWPLVLGFGLSAVVQALVSHRTLAR